MNLIEVERRERFRLLYSSFVRPVSGYALRRAKPDDAGDIVSETFLVAWRRLDDVPGGDEALPWLYGVARRLLANQRRSFTRRGNLSKKLRNHYALAAPPFTKGGGPLDRLDEMVDSLNEQERELLFLSVWEGLKSQEVAVVLGISDVAVRSRLHRVKQKMKRELER